MRKLGKVARLGLAGLMALPLSLGGCMSMQPVRDQQGNVIVDQYGNPMYRPQFDAGKTARVVGGGILGTVAGAHHAGKIVDYDAANKAALMGRGMQAWGRMDDERGHYDYPTQPLDNWRGQQWQQNQPNYFTGLVGTEPFFFTCNNWIDLNGDGKYDSNEVVGVKNRFSPNERIQLVGKIQLRKNRRVELKVSNFNGEIVLHNSMIVPDDVRYYIPAFENGLPPGNYVATWADGQTVIGKSEFSVDDE